MPEMGRIVISRPKNCLYCEGVFYGIGQVIDYVQARGMNVTSLDASQARNGIVVDTISDQDPAFFFGFGHGLPYLFTGDDGGVIYSLYNIGNLQNRVTYLLSCLTARQLGPAIAGLGGQTAYTGYYEEFTWKASAIEQDVLEDFHAQGFYDSAFTIVYAMADGKTVQQARDDCHSRFDHWINIWETERKDDPYAAEVVKWLLFDQDILRIHGDVSATVHVPSGLRSILSGTVRDGDQYPRPPLEGVTVTASGWSTTTNVKGRYSLEVPSGIYNIEYRFPGYSIYSIQIDMSTPGNYNRDIYLSAAPGGGGEESNIIGGVFAIGALFGGAYLLSALPIAIPIGGIK